MKHAEDSNITEWVVDTTNKAKSQKKSLQRTVFEYRANLKNYQGEIDTGPVHEEQLTYDTVNLIDSILHYQNLKESLCEAKSRAPEISEHLHIDGRTYDSGELLEEIEETIEDYDKLIGEGIEMCLEAERELNTDFNTQEAYRTKKMRKNNISEVNDRTFVPKNQEDEPTKEAIEMFFDQEFSS